MKKETSPGIAQAERIGYIFLFAVVYAYLWLRAIYVPFVHDEIATFYHYIQTGRFLPYLSHWDANNHFFNSALTWLSYRAFGLSEWSLRLPNLLAALLLFWAIYKLVGEIRHRWLRVTWVVVLVMNHFFMEYLALSRGYGMSMAFLLVALWFTIRLVRDNATGNYAWLVLMILAMLFSNLTLIYSVLILLLVASLAAVLKNQDHPGGFVSRMAILLTGGYIPLALAVQYLFELRTKELLYYGIEGGFWKVTVESLAFNSAGTEGWWLLLFIIFLFVLIIIVALKRFAESTNLLQILKPGYLFYYLLLGNLFMFIALHYLLGIKYPEDRVGMFFIPFFLGSLIFSVDYLHQRKPKSLAWLVVIPLVIVPLNFVRSMNLGYTTYWKTMGVPEHFYERISKNQVPGDLPPVVGGHWLRSYFWAMEDYRGDGKANLLHHADSTEVTDDYLIYNMDRNPEWNVLYDSIDYDPVRDIHLLKRKKPMIRQWVSGTGTFETTDSVDATYHMLMKSRLDTLTGEDLIYEWNMWIKSPDVPFRGAIVLDVSDAWGRNVYYKSYQLYHQRPAWNRESGKAHNCIKVTHLPEGSKTFKLYLWNPENDIYILEDGIINIYRLKEPDGLLSPEGRREEDDHGEKLQSAEQHQER